MGAKETRYEQCQYSLRFVSDCIRADLDEYRKVDNPHDKEMGDKIQALEVLLGMLVCMKRMLEMYDYE